MRIAYFDAFSGVSGDMTIGAFLDLGLPLEVLEDRLAPLALEGVRLEVGSRVRSGIRATKFTVHVEALAGGAPGTDDHRHPRAHHAHDHGASGEHQHGSHDHGGHEHSAHDHGDPGHGEPARAHGERAYREIRALLAGAALEAGVRERAQAIFRALAQAEARVHACEVDDVRFHEVGALDAIVDVVGTAIALEHFAVDRIHVSPLPLGSGFARSMHGRIPVPAPATIELLRGFPTLPGEGSAELVTPTGAAILAALATPGAPPPLVPLAVGYGAGDRELSERPNLLRVVLAEPAPAEAIARPAAVAVARGLEHDEMVVLEANIDDMNPELFEAAVESLFAAGARDVSLTPIVMKRGRPGTLLRLIAAPGDADRLAEVVLRETTSIGVRQHAVTRRKLPRERRAVTTRFGSIDVKEVALPDGTRRVTPEYSQCLRAARAHGVAVATVYEETLRRAWREGDRIASPERSGAPSSRGDFEK